MSRPWTDEEIGYLVDHADTSKHLVAEELGRSVSAIENARHKLRNGWTGNQTPAWTDDEDEILYLAGPTATAKSLVNSLPGRTAGAIRKRRVDLGIKTLGRRPTEIGSRPLVAKSCLGCGLLLAGSWFHSVKKKGGLIAWHPYCRRCSSAKSVERQKENRPRTNERIKRYEDRLQQASLRGADRAGEPYTEADYDVLADQSLTDFQKAIRLKRSWKAVGSARRAGGFKSKPDGLGDPERDVWVIHNPNLEQLGASA